MEGPTRRREWVKFAATRQYYHLDTRLRGYDNLVQDHTHKSYTVILKLLKPFHSPIMFFDPHG
ncbi:MAG: hypothetical protein SCALA702_22300 [Melioribacteraceae bacterium]|nr:MAG: hypothetical protein SCALA702_22300 [Melioribacteraceae bacterium]